MGEVVSIFDKKPMHEYASSVKIADINDVTQPSWLVTKVLIKSWVGELVDIIELDHYGPELVGPKLEAFEKDIQLVIEKHFLK